MRKILFLDFDGVLHGDSHPLFSKMDRFEHYLLKMPDVEVVISSSWRETHPFEQLKALFSVSLRERIIGMTPSLEYGFAQGGRQREIEAYLEAAALCEANALWVALDDIDYLFDDQCANLISIDPNQGFGDGDGAALLEWYRQATHHIAHR